MTAFIHRFAFAVFAAAALTAGAQAGVKDPGFATSRIEHISVETWEAAETRAYDTKRAHDIGAIKQTLNDGARWVAVKGRHAALTAVDKAESLVAHAGRAVVGSIVDGHRTLAAAMAPAGRDLILTAHDIAAEGRRLVTEARFAGPATIAVRYVAAEARRLAAGVGRSVVRMVAEGRRAAMHAAFIKEAFKSGFRVDVAHAVGEVLAARFAAAPEAVPAVRVWNLSHGRTHPAAALVGGAKGGLGEFAAPRELEGRADLINARFDVAIHTVQRAGIWLWSAR
jgi:hypothetical protein